MCTEKSYKYIQKMLNVYKKGRHQNLNIKHVNVAFQKKLKCTKNIPDEYKKCIRWMPNVQHGLKK